LQLRLLALETTATAAAAAEEEVVPILPASIQDATVDTAEPQNKKHPEQHQHLRSNSTPRSRRRSSKTGKQQQPLLGTTICRRDHTPAGAAAVAAAF
jgi:hypothetical protein